MADLGLFELHFDHREGHEALIESAAGSAVKNETCRFGTGW
jgi:hypothetical protein